MADGLLTLGYDIDIRGRDFAFTASGDLRTVAGIDRIGQDLMLGAITMPGTLLLHPDFGAGLIGTLDQPMTDDQLANIGQTLADMALLNAAVDSVQTVVLPDPTHVNPLDVTIIATLVGGQTVALPVALT